MNGRAAITGAASGIGLATGRLLAGRGMAVTGIDRQQAAAGTPPERWAERWILADLARESDVTAACAELGRSPISHLVLCAGVAGVGAVDHVLRVNFLAARQMLALLGPAVADGGAITVVSSGAGWRWGDRREALLAIVEEPDPARALAAAASLCPDAAAAYNLSKELLCAMVARHCLDHWPRGVRLNSVSPGGVDTPLIGAFTASMGTAAMDFSTATVGRNAQPVEVAEVIAFLGEDRARWINGTDIKVDGGLVGALAGGAARFTGWE